MASNNGLRTKCTSDKERDLASYRDLHHLVAALFEDCGQPPTVTVNVEGRKYKLHKGPLVSRSMYMRRQLEKTLVINLPETFPGGAQCFEKIATYCYGPKIQLCPGNVAAMRCAAHFLEMTEDIDGRKSLCDRTDLFLTQVVLQKWEDTLTVLQSCQTLVPLAEELLIVSRCVESLAFMACMEVFDPDSRRARAVTIRERDFSAKDWWINDLLDLPLYFFRLVVSSIRQNQMKEKFVSPALIRYANKWVLSTNSKYEKTNKVHVIEGLVRLLPNPKKRSEEVPINFLFSLLSKALNLGCSHDINMNLQKRIVSQLELATIEDFLLPSEGHRGSVFSSIEVQTMVGIMRMFMTNMHANEAQKQSVSELRGDDLTSETVVGFSIDRVSIVANLWDEYLAQISEDPSMDVAAFLELVEIVPVSGRSTHDQLFKAIEAYLMAHPDLTEEHRNNLSRPIDTKKLSQSSCIQLVRNEKMPMRLIVKAMFSQHLYTRRVINAVNNARSIHSAGTSQHFSSSQELNYTTTTSDEGSQALGDELNKVNVAMRQEYEATSSKVRDLEQELQYMREKMKKAKSKNSSRSKSMREQLERDHSPLMGNSNSRDKGIVHKFMHRFQKYGFSIHKNNSQQTNSELQIHPHSPHITCGGVLPKVPACGRSNRHQWLR